jgi:hypothetical protein
MKNNLLFSSPRIHEKRPFKPNKFKKYHERELTHVASNLGTSIPLCNMDLKLFVNEKGNLTSRFLEEIEREEIITILYSNNYIEYSRFDDHLTQKKAAEKISHIGHNDSLRYKIRHIFFHSF